MAVAHHIHLARSRCAQGRGSARGNAVIGIELDVVQPCVVGGLDQQRQVRTPVARDHRIGARLLDLGDIGGKVTHLGQGREVVTHDFHIGALLLEHFLGVFGNLLAVAVVLVDQIDLLDLGHVLHISGQGFHLHGSVGIEAEMPVAAFAVGQVGVHGRIVEEHHFLALVTGIVLFQCIHDGQRRTRAIALEDIAHALVHGRAQGRRGFLRAQLVVNADDFKLHARSTVLVDLFGCVLQALELVGAQCRHQAGQRVDPCHFHRLTLLGHGATCTRQDHRCCQSLDCKLH